MNGDLSQRLLRLWLSRHEELSPQFARHAASNFPTASTISDVSLMWATLDYLNFWQQVGLLSVTLLAVIHVGQVVYERLSLPKHAEPRRRPKGTLPILYNTFQLAAHMHHMHDWMVAQCESFDGKTFWIRIMGQNPIAVVSSPELFEDVLKTHFETFDKGPRAITILRDLLGDGIFAVDGSKWVHQRKTASNLFSLRSLRESMTESVQKHGLVLNKILNQAAQANKSIDLFSLLNRFTIEAFAEIGFGVELGALDAETEHPFQAAFDRAQRILKRRAARPPLFWKTQRLLNLGAERELKASIRTIDDTVFGIIQKSLANRASRAHSTPESSSTSGKKDIVSLFLDNVSSNTSSSGSFDPVFLRDIVVNFLIAGRDTTAQALSWFFYCLSQNPDVETKIRNEIASKLPDLVSGRIQTPSMEQTNELLYLEATLRETLRLYPSVPANVKQANKDVVLSDGSFIKKGQAVIISSYLLARMTHVWGADAKQFKPERWIDAETGKMISMTSFKFPAFHAGPRLCLGMNLAMMEMKIIASMVLSKFHLELVAGQHITYDYSLTLPIRGQLMMEVVTVG
ncbi:Cytochrome p450, partial [Globisporangium splendens]